MGVKDILKLHQVPFDEPEFDERMSLLVSGLRRSADYAAKSMSFKRQKGGAVPVLEGMPSQDDFLGPHITTFINSLSIPLVQNILRSMFMLIFLMGFLEKVPVFGSILSAALDIMLTGGKMLIKTVQKALPPLMGLAPIPYASMVGIGMAAVFGMVVWPLLAMVSFSRQDYVAAIDAFVRVVPPPFGDTLADLFMDANRTVGRLDAKRKKLGQDIADAIQLFGDSMSTFKEQANTLADKTREVAALPSKVVGGRRHGFSRKTSRHKKWKTRRRQRK